MLRYFLCSQRLAQHRLSEESKYLPIQTVAKLLGYAVVAGAAIVKLPQIIKIIQRKSVFGVSFQSVLFEVCQILLSLSHRYAQSLTISIGKTLSAFTAKLS